MTCWPVYRRYLSNHPAIPSAAAGAPLKQGLQQIAAGGRLPVQHFAHGEDTRQAARHQVLIT